MKDNQDIQRRYRKAKRIYWALLAALLLVLIAFQIISPPGEHAITSLEGVMFLSLLVIAVAMYMVLRCPKCRAFLVPAFSGAWGRLKYCPRCGVALTGGGSKEDKEP